MPITGKITAMIGIQTAAIRFLSEKQVPFKLFTHTGQVTSFEQAAKERNHLPGQVIRSLLFRIGDGSFAMVLIAGPAQVSWPKLRQHFGQNRLTMAAPQEVLEITGCRVGAVSPFGLPKIIPILADNNIIAYDEVSLGSGLAGTAILMRSADLVKNIENLYISDFASLDNNAE